MASKSTFSPEEKAALVRQWMKSKKTMRVFCESKGLKPSTFAGWVQTWHQGVNSVSSCQRGKKKSKRQKRKTLQSVYITDIDDTISFSVFAICRGE